MATFNWQLIIGDILWSQCLSVDVICLESDDDVGYARKKIQTNMQFF